VIYKQADTYIIQLENGVVIEEAILGNGESGYVIK
jgi:hypothetical protein